MASPADNPGAAARGWAYGIGAFGLTALGSATVLFLTAPSPSDPSGIAVGPLLVIGGRFR